MVLKMATLIGAKLLTSLPSITASLMDLIRVPAILLYRPQKKPKVRPTTNTSTAHTAPPISGLLPDWQSRKPDPATSRSTSQPINSKPSVRVTSGKLFVDFFMSVV